MNTLTGKGFFGMFYESVGMPREVIAYHKSKKLFDKFSMDCAGDNCDGGGVGLFFAEDPDDANAPGKYLYKVKLTLGRGKKWERGMSEDSYDYIYDEISSGKVYKMLTDNGIEILEVMNAYTGEKIA